MAFRLCAIFHNLLAVGVPVCVCRPALLGVCPVLANLSCTCVQYRLGAQWISPHIIWVFPSWFAFNLAPSSGFDSCFKCFSLVVYPKNWTVNELADYAWSDLIVLENCWWLIVIVFKFVRGEDRCLNLRATAVCVCFVSLFLKGGWSCWDTYWV